ncbi:Rrf2 family transcriptional regulator [Sphingobium sp. AN558]|uniref:RrF2 family transcriptional regulator n=1 Tax=Sphingobium sp. AN558 TaxID=3133442 RepID=UPI0030BE7AB3
MQLTQHTDFGLRLLIVLARSGGGPVPLTGFATAHKLSYNHVVKVAQALVHAGFITSQRGRSGGVTLARPAEGVSIGEVVRALEPNLRLADCAGCVLRADCATSGILAKAMAAFMAVLDETPLSQAAETDSPAFPAWAMPQGAGLA